MTPLGIEIALHYCTRVDDFESGSGRFNAPAVQDTLRQFFDQGLLEMTAPGVPVYIASDGLRLYVEELCKVPLPIKTWVMP